jgi:hypothetical protein
MSQFHLSINSRELKGYFWAYIALSKIICELKKFHLGRVRSFANRCTFVTYELGIAGTDPAQVARRSPPQRPKKILYSILRNRTLHDRIGVCICA